MAVLETYTVKPSGLFPMTIKALDGNHLGYILNEMFTQGPWRELDDTLPVEISPPVGEVRVPSVKNFRSK